MTVDVSLAMDNLSRIRNEPWRCDPVSFAVYLSNLRNNPRMRFIRRPHLTLVGQQLAKARLGHGPNRVGIFMPPRHGKSELGSKWFPLWTLDNDPNSRVIITSYGAEFAASWGGAIRNLADEFAPHLSFNRPSGGSDDNWGTGTERGGVRTAGVGGPITGKGGDVIIIDDPVKNAEEAYSKTYQKKTWEWYQSTIYTRLEPGSVLILIMTRWHDSDLGGRIKEAFEAKQNQDSKEHEARPRHFDGGKNADMAEDADDIADSVNVENEPDYLHEDFCVDAEDTLMEPPDEEWKFIDMGALAKPDDPLGRREGQALWPSRFPRKRLLQIKAVVGPWVWSALYQQSPTIEGGDIFQRQWFSYWEYTDASKSTFRLESTDDMGNKRERVFPKALCVRFQTIDLAISEAEKADYFVITSFYLTPENDILVAHCLREKVRGPNQRHVIREQHRLRQSHCIGIESTAYQMTLVQEMQDEGLPVIELRADRAKEIRAMTAAARYSARKIFHPAGDPDWLQEFEDELIAFPTGAHDDMVDTVSYAAYGVAMGLFKRVSKPKRLGEISSSLSKKSRWDKNTNVST